MKSSNAQRNTGVLSIAQQQTGAKAEYRLRFCTPSRSSQPSALEYKSTLVFSSRPSTAAKLRGMAVCIFASLGADCRPSLRHGQFRAIEWPAGKQTGAKAEYRFLFWSYSSTASMVPLRLLFFYP
jgi:hypothetical protein